METLNALGNVNTPWGDMLYEEQYDWIAHVNAQLNRLRGDGVALLQALAQFAQGTQAVPEVDEATRNWRVWLDMVEEPEKYGADIGDWFAVDEELRRGPKRWRVDAYWNGKTRELEDAQADAATKLQALWRGVQARQRFACGTCDATPLVSAEWDTKTPGLCRECAAATKLQALWRGHNLRYVLAPRFTCSHCLKHGVCPTGSTTDRYTWFCAECTGELWGDDPTEVCDDCGDDIVSYGAKVGGLWLCPACIHSWDVCLRCDHAFRLGTRCDNHCLECGDDLTGLGQTNGFCSGDCHYAWERGNLM